MARNGCTAIDFTPDLSVINIQFCPYPHPPRSPVQLSSLLLSSYSSFSPTPVQPSQSENHNERCSAASLRVPACLSAVTSSIHSLKDCHCPIIGSPPPEKSPPPADPGKDLSGRRSYRGRNGNILIRGKHINSVTSFSRAEFSWRDILMWHRPMQLLNPGRRRAISHAVVSRSAWS